MKIMKKTLFIAGFLLSGLTLNAYANPQGESVVAGSATFDRSTPNTLNINTASNKTIINYNSFSIANNETTRINQPSASSAALNRVVGVDPSQILGNLSSNGQIFLVNPNGIIFGAGSQVNAPAIVASTLDINNNDFLNGNYTFFKNGGNAYIINQGRIAAQPGGYVALLSQSVNNQGVILADSGSIALASGNQMTIALDSLDQISVTVDEAVQSEVIGPDGQKITSAISNSGTIQANGGKVLLTAKVMNDVFDYAVNNSGVITAGAISNNGGVIELTASGAPVINTGPMTANTVNINVQNTDLLNKGSIVASLLGDQSNTGNISINAVNILQAGLISADAELDLTAPGAIETDPTANNPSYPVGGTLLGKQVNLIAGQFGSSDVPLNVSGTNINITVPQGNIDVSGSAGVGSNILLRGPPAGFGAIVYNQYTNLTLNSSTGSINVAPQTEISANNITLTAQNGIVVDGTISASNGTPEFPNGGEVTITAATVLQQGTISANAAEGGTAGEVSIVSETSTTLDAGSTTEARALGLAGNGGAVVIDSKNGNTRVNANAVIDVSAGSASGNAGRIELGAFDQLGFYGILNGLAPLKENSATVTFTYHSPSAPPVIIITDKADYPPSGTPVISGSGFLPNQTVTINIFSPDGTQVSLSTVADAQGRFTTTYIPANGLLDGQYFATGSDGVRSAVVKFTDFSIITFNVSGTVEFAVNTIGISGAIITDYTDPGLTTIDKFTTSSADGTWSLSLATGVPRYVVVTPPAGDISSGVTLGTTPSGGSIFKISNSEIQVSGSSGGTSTGNSFLMQRSITVTTTTTANITAANTTANNTTEPNLIAAGLNNQLVPGAGGTLGDHRLGPGFENQPSFFFYHPLTNVDNSAFDNIVLDAGAYDFIHNELVNELPCSELTGEQLLLAHHCHPNGAL